MKRFLWKLIPPRPTFAQDMTEEERRQMQEHGAYWSDLVKRGIAVVFGLFADPKGAWGVGIVDVESEADARSLCLNDPTVKSGLNKVEVYPMPRPTLRT